MQTPLVTPQWLHENIDNPHLIILDASQNLAETGNVFIKNARYSRKISKNDI